LAKSKERKWGKGFGQDVSGIIGALNVRQQKIAVLDTITEVVPTNIEMLDPCVKKLVARERDGAVVVAQNRGTFGLGNAETPE
jgi:hypothetical protein